jgi:uncharacterized Ntn-hydrolase superfamily protein
MKKRFILFALVLQSFFTLKGQDTFSILAIDSLSGEIGAAGASCVDLYVYYVNSPIDFIAEVIPNVGAIATQAAFDPVNQQNAKSRMMAGDNPAQIINWLKANDVQSNPNNRQYGVVKFVEGSPKSACHTGVNCFAYKNHISGPNYSIQGNILIGQHVLDSMEARFLREPGDLACKLMAAMQGAKLVGADSRCAPNNSSSLFAFLKVAAPGDDEANPSLRLALKTANNAKIEPIDSLQKLFDASRSCTINTTGFNKIKENKVKLTVYPNPTHNLLLIKLYGGKTALCKIFNVMGQEIDSLELMRESTLDVSTWTSGLYYLEAELEGELIRTKLLVE